MHHGADVPGMVGTQSIGLKAFTPTDRMADWPQSYRTATNCWGGAQCSPVTMHAFHVRYLLSVHGEAGPAQDVSVAKALSMYQRGGHVPEGRPRTDRYRWHQSRRR